MPRIFQSLNKYPDVYQVDSDSEPNLSIFISGAQQASTPLRPISEVHEETAMVSSREEFTIISPSDNSDDEVHTAPFTVNLQPIPQLQEITVVGESLDTKVNKEETSRKSGRKKGSIIEGEVPTSDDEFAYDVNNPKIKVRKALHTTLSKRTWQNEKKNTRYNNASYACPFGCPGLKSNFSNHVRSQMHKREREMIEINEATDAEAQRLIDVLRYKSTHRHNRKVIEEGQGEILLPRKQGSISMFDVKQYGPCPYCFQWLSISFITRHIPDCKALPEGERKPRLGEVRVQSRLMSGHLKTNASTLLKREVFSIMKCDTIGVTAQSDPIIIALGNDWMTRNIGNKINRSYYTSQVMRLAARLKLALNMEKDEPEDLVNYIKPDQFPAVCKAVLRISQQDEDNEEEFKAPSNAIKIKYDLKRLACIKLTEAIIEKNALRQKDAEDFSKLMDMSYTDNLAKVALFNKMLNARKPLPDPNDIKTLSAYLNKEILNFNSIEVSYEQYKRAVVLAEAKLISFNRRRCGEVQQIL